MTQPRFKLDYWPLPFRGCFVSYLYAYRDVPLLMETGLEENNRLRSMAPEYQSVPYIAPPVLTDNESGAAISQMPAIVLYASAELNLLPPDHVDTAMAMKIIMDCNDLLMEICRYNGSMMWTRKEWNEFRSVRLPHWLAIFEESLKRGTIGKAEVSFADIGVYALFGNMTRCLPELEADLQEYAPGIRALCQSIGAQPSLAQYVAEEELKFGKLYCGGQIEDSIREMLALDVLS